jgi:hypothetical protein
MTGPLGDVVTHVSAIVCPPSSREALTTHGPAPRGPRYPWDTAAYAAASHHRADAHDTRSRFQLHSRPPRQRLPSSLVIESASAPPARLGPSMYAEALPMNASD